MIRSRALTVVVGPRHTAYVTEGAHVVPVFNRLGIPRQWSPARRCWSIPANRADDLIAYCEHAEGRAITVENEQ